MGSHSVQERDPDIPGTAHLRTTWQQRSEVFGMESNGPH